MLARIQGAASTPPNATPEARKQETCTIPAPAYPPPPRNLDELLTAGSEDQFLEESYQTLMLRPVDPEGLATSHRHIQAGHSRCAVYLNLRYSDEARRTRVRLPREGLIRPVGRIVELIRRIGLQRLARRIDRGYCSWRQLKALLNGSGMRRQAMLLDAHQRMLRQGLNEQHTLMRQGLDEQHTLMRQGLDEQHTLMRQGLDEQHTLIRAIQRHTYDVLHQEIEARHQEAQASLSSHHSRLNEHAETQRVLKGKLAQNDHLFDTHRQLMQDRQEDQQHDLQLLRARINIIQHGVLPPRDAPDTTPRPQPAIAGVDLAARINSYYIAFEETHRGSEDDIRDKQSVYLKHLLQIPPERLHLPMLDIGCGRGEWLRLLTENGFRAIGIDLNPDMVQHCNRHGLDAHTIDAIAWLKQQSDNSHAAISAFHVIEHLPFETLFQLMEESLRVLAPGGLLILETPNPENPLVGSHTFYHDFSHIKPVTPVSLRFLAGYHGLEVIAMPRLAPYPESARLEGSDPVIDRINGWLCGPQDYGLIARKPAMP